MKNRWTPVQYSPRRQSGLVLADYGGKDLWKMCVLSSDVNKDWTCKDKDFTYSYLLQVAAKPTIAIKQQQ